MTDDLNYLACEMFTLYNFIRHLLSLSGEEGV